MNKKKYNSYLAPEEQIAIINQDNLIFPYTKIVVHGMNFHMDDLLCVTFAKILNPDIQIIRTNNMNDIIKYQKDINTLVADIGRGFFDHHQEHSIMSSSDGHKLCAAGIIYQIYGSLIWKKMDGNIDPIIFDGFMQQVDLHDNFGDYHSFSNLIDVFVPCWNDNQSSEFYDNRFLEVVDILYTLLTPNRAPNCQISSLDIFDIINPIIDTIHLDPISAHILIAGICSKNITFIDKVCNRLETLIFHKQKSKEEAINIITELYQKSDNKYILVMDSFIPFNEALTYTDTLFVIYPSNRGGWNIQTVKKISEKQSTNRYSLNDDSYLSKESLLKNNPHCTFLHNSGFLASFDSKEEAIKAATNIVRDIIEYIKQESEKIITPDMQMDVSCAKLFMTVCNHFYNLYYNSQNNETNDNMIELFQPQNSIKESDLQKILQPLLENAIKMVTNIVHELYNKSLEFRQFYYGLLWSESKTLFNNYKSEEILQIFIDFLKKYGNINVKLSENEILFYYIDLSVTAHS